MSHTPAVPLSKGPKQDCKHVTQHIHSVDSNESLIVVDEAKT